MHARRGHLDAELLGRLRQDLNLVAGCSVQSLWCGVMTVAKRRSRAFTRPLWPLACSGIQLLHTSGVTVEHMAPNNGYHAGGRAKGDELNKIERRRREVAHLITVHYTCREMAERLGVASSTISEDVKVIRERWRDRAIADYGSHLAEELAKLDLREHELLPTALSGGPKGGVNLRAVDRVLAIRDRRARMLGLDSPSQLEVTMRVEQVAKATSWSLLRWA